MNTSTPQVETLPLPPLSDELLLRTANSRSVWSDSRRYPRLTANCDSDLIVASTFASQGHESKCQVVRMRDISRAGLRFLHGDQLFPGERCTLTLPNAASLRLEVVWCRRVEAGVFMTGCSYVRNGE